MGAFLRGGTGKNPLSAPDSAKDGSRLRTGGDWQEEIRPAVEPRGPLEDGEATAGGCRNTGTAQGRTVGGADSATTEQGGERRPAGRQAKGGQTARPSPLTIIGFPACTVNRVYLIVARLSNSDANVGRLPPCGRVTPLSPESRTGDRSRAKARLRPCGIRSLPRAGTIAGRHVRSHRDDHITGTTLIATATDHAARIRASQLTADARTPMTEGLAPAQVNARHRHAERLA